MKHLRWAALALAAGLAVLLSACSSSGPNTIPTPSVTQMFPSNIVAGSDDFQLSVAGALFISDKRGATTVLWNGSPRSTTFDKSTGELVASITKADVATAGIAQVTAENPSPGGISLGSLTFTIVAQTPGLTLASSAPLSPASASAGGAAFTLTATGAGFGSNYVVTWNGSPRPTTIDSSGITATAQISAEDIATEGSASVAVADPGLLLATPSATFTISGKGAGVPVIISATPASATTGSGSFQMRITGEGFSRGAAVEWNGARLPTSFQSSTQLVVTVSDSAVAMVGVANLNVVNQPSGGTSASFPFRVR